jgi:putative ABC transport system permease protein
VHDADYAVNHWPTRSVILNTQGFREVCVSSLLQDLRYAWRTLTNSPGFTAVALITLALGIGANTAIFSFVDGLLLRPLPYKDASRIVRVMEKPPLGERNGISTLNFLDWQKDNTVFDFMAAQNGASMTLTGEHDPVQLRAGRVSAHFFDIFGIKATLGRTFLPGEDQSGKDKVVVLSHALWVSQFGADPSIINRKVSLDNAPYIVVGVLPAGGAFDRAFAQLWRPLAFEPSNMTRNFHWMISFARLKDGVSLQQARANMDTIGARIARDFPQSNKGWGVVVEPYADTLIGPQLRTSLLVLLTATGLVLLIGCANLANLSLARGVSREREVAVRASLGAGRSRLVRQFLTENVLLSVCGGVLGIGVGYGLMSWLQTLIPPFSFAREAEITMDVRVLSFSLALSVCTGVLFGLAPAWHATTPDLAGVMKEGGRGSSGGSRKILREALIVSEVALAFVLLVGSGLMMRSFFTLMNAEMGFDGTNVLTMTLPIATERFPDPERLNLYLREIRTAVEAVPGVKETAYSCAPPMRGTCYGMPWQVADRPLENKANRQGGFFKIVSASYFSTLRLQLVKGRALSDRDAKGSPRVLVINERLARRDFKDADPIGRRLLIEEIIPGKTELGPDIAWEIVGVIRDEKVMGMDDDRSAGVYVSNEQSPAYGGTLSVRAGSNPATLLKSITAAIQSVNKDQTITDIRTVDEIKELSVAPNRIQSTLLGIFGTVAVVLAAIGIYGVISYSVAQRTHEIGIRAALGATNGGLVRLILVRGLVLTSAGLTIGLAGALGLTRLMTSILYGVGARDPGTMIAVASILAGVAAAACYVPARRATKVDPIVALRYE